ncbi:ADP-dependent glucokinase/phosphofructokinase [Jiangella gansuensis]|uniref:ADP-dependent glucokinase/phosphofructokinase n=1 Tax=Jiangella gansuensis TaxID=281473 RepID=UPI0004B3F89B|nr:ADP-dependent glucokinase/phosphofructokinase [Jiangella gansuensis]
MNERVVLGLGGTVDYEIAWDGPTIERLVLEHDIRAGELSTSVPIDSERSLLITLLAFVRDGVGGERFVASSDIVTALADRFDTRVTLGGTCVRAALAMATIGVGSTVHLVSIDDHVRRLLPPDISYLCSAAKDSLDPHLIVQFPAGARVRANGLDLCAPHSNRLIYVHDPPNRDLRLHSGLGDALARADAFLISGLNSIQDPAVLTERLRELRGFAGRLPAGALTFYEDAGYHVPEIAAAARDGVLGLVDVYSMNEDELQERIGRTVDLLDPAQVVRAAKELSAAVPAPVVVVHTKYWSIALGPDAGRFEDALRGGIALASARYLAGDDLTAADYRAVAHRPPHPGGAAVVEAVHAAFGASARGVPAYVLDTAHPTNIGLGDTFVGGFLAALTTPDAAPHAGPAVPRAEPVVLPANQPADRFYRGGERIARFRGSAPGAGREPEDWVASTTAVFGQGDVGLTRLPDGDLLAEAVRRDPRWWLGPRHVTTRGADTALLVKLLDAGERLPVHVHPDVPFAHEHLGLGHGKTEAWVMLEPAEVRLGWNRDVDAAELAGWVERQDVDAMLAAMHTLRLERGDAVFVPAGLPHAIGAGAFLVELQEPTDLSVLLEWDGFAIDGPRDGHLGIGYPAALGAVERAGRSRAEVEALRTARDSTVGDLIPAASEFFRVERRRGEVSWAAGFAVLVVVAGSAELVTGSGARLPVTPGQSVLLPYAAGACSLERAAGLEVLLCRPPV